MNKNIIDVIDIIDDTKDIIEGGWVKERETLELKNFVIDSIEKINSEIINCDLCNLCKHRNNTVPGAGVINPEIMIVGEAPGAKEDETGNPFVGKAGQYLDKWLSAIDLYRNKDCFIGNIIKCRPPGNRDPLPDEIEACKMYLIRQLKIIKPKIIVTLGRFAAQFICQTQEGMGRLRGKVYYYEGIPVVPTYHPSAVLRNPKLRQEVWKDLKTAKKMLNEIY